MSEPLPNPRRRRKWFFIAAAAVLVAVACTVIWLSNDNFEYDETAHRNVIEAYNGPVADWDTYRDSTLDACKFDEDTFELFVLMESDLARLQLDIKYACPDRMDEFTDITGMEPLD